LALSGFSNIENRGKDKDLHSETDSTGCWYAILAARIAAAPKKEGKAAIRAIGVDLGTRRQNRS